MSYLYTGNFKKYIENLIEQKNAIGYPYGSPSRILKVFAAFCNLYYPKETALTKEIALHWAQIRPNEHVNGLIRRITPIRQLAKYMNSIGVEAYVIPEGIPGKAIRYVPHIYTKLELKTFFLETDKIPYNPNSPAKHLVIPVLFRVLYCCGLRPSEARLLKVNDIDLKTGKLIIRESKGHKDRTVMMTADVLRLCRIYQEKVNLIFPNRIWFFPNHRGALYSKCYLDAIFRILWEKTGILISSGNPPRVHDFRHSFAVKRLNLWVKDGLDLNALLPFLSIYLGHAHLTEMDYYLHLVPEFFPVFMEKTAGKCNSLIPEVQADEER